jgi:hypothetical protein
MTQQVATNQQPQQPSPQEQLTQLWARRGQLTYQLEQLSAELQQVMGALQQISQRAAQEATPTLSSAEMAGTAGTSGAAGSTT